MESRVTAIRALVEPACWQHCPGKDNPADIPSRGMDSSALFESTIWLCGPDWLWSKPSREWSECGTGVEVPDDCLQEMRRRDLTHTLVTKEVVRPLPTIGQLVDVKCFSSHYRLFRVTAIVLRFVRCLRNCLHDRDLEKMSRAEEIAQAELLWVKDAQVHLPKNKDFPSLENRFGLYTDENGVWRCRGRMSNADMPFSARNPILLDRDHGLTALLIIGAHHRVLHNGVAETLAELRSKYWIVRGRQLVKRQIGRCVTCKKLEGLPYKGIAPPPLPDFRVTKSRPFQTTGVDYVGPMYVKGQDSSGSNKVWMILYTCYTTRAVHLDLVRDMTSKTFIRSLRRLAARRGAPNRSVRQC